MHIFFDAKSNKYKISGVSAALGSSVDYPSVVDKSQFRQRDDLIRHFMATGKINSTAQLLYDHAGDPVLADYRDPRNDIVDRDRIADDYISRKTKEAQDKAYAESVRADRAAREQALADRFQPVDDSDNFSSDNKSGKHSKS